MKKAIDFLKRNYKPIVRVTINILILAVIIDYFLTKNGVMWFGGIDHDYHEREKYIRLDGVSMYYGINTIGTQVIHTTKVKVSFIDRKFFLDDSFAESYLRSKAKKVCKKYDREYVDDIAYGNNWWDNSVYYEYLCLEEDPYENEEQREEAKEKLKQDLRDIHYPMEDGYDSARDKFNGNS